MTHNSGTSNNSGMNDKNSGRVEILDGGAEESTGRDARPAMETEAAAAADNAAAELQQALAAAREEAARNYELYLRALADADNIKKRAQRDKEQYVLYANESLVKKLLSQLDNLEKAIENAALSQDYAILAKGVEMIYKNMLDILKSEGIECIECIGKCFDPRLHQPLATEDSDEHPDNTIIEEYQKGYTMHDRLLRPSLVKVNQPG